MSSDTRTGVENGDRSRQTPAVLGWRRSLAGHSREQVAAAAGGLSLFAVGTATLLRLLHNIPFDPVAIPAAIRHGSAALAHLAVALALVALAVTATRASVRVGLLFAGIFGALTILDSTATVPAALAVPAGGALALVGALGRPSSYRAVRRLVVAAGFVAAVGVSLASTVGLLDGTARGFGGLLALGALTAASIRIEGDRVALLAGVVAFLAVALAGIARPFVLGSALLVGFAVVGVPNLLTALAAGAGVALVTAGVRRRAVPLALGGGLLVLAGVPATIPRALTVLLGVTLVLPAWDDPALAAEGVSE